MLSLGGFFRRHQEDAGSGGSGSLHRKQQQLQVGPLAPLVAGSQSPSPLSPAHKTATLKSPSPGCATASPFKSSAAPARSPPVHSSSLSSSASTYDPSAATSSSSASQAAAAAGTEEQRDSALGHQQLDASLSVPEAAAASSSRIRSRAATAPAPKLPKQKASGAKVHFSQKTAICCEKNHSGAVTGTHSAAATGSPAAAAASGTSKKMSTAAGASGSGCGAPSLAAPEIALNVRRSSVVGLATSKSKIVHSKARRTRKKTSTATAPNALLLLAADSVGAGGDSSPPSPPEASAAASGRSDGPAAQSAHANSAALRRSAMARAGSGVSIAAPEIVISPEPSAFDAANCDSSSTRCCILYSILKSNFIVFGSHKPLFTDTNIIVLQNHFHDIS